MWFVHFKICHNAVVAWERSLIPFMTRQLLPSQCFLWCDCCLWRVSHNVSVAVFWPCLACEIRRVLGGMAVSACSNHRWWKSSLCPLLWCECSYDYWWKSKAYSTWYSQAVSHPSTNQARPCLASEIRRDRACSGWYGRKLLNKPNLEDLKLKAIISVCII